MKKLIYFLFEAGIKTSSFLPYVNNFCSGEGDRRELAFKAASQERKTGQERRGSVDNKQVVLSLPLMHPKQGICSS